MKTLIVTDARVIKKDNKYYTENTFFDIISRYSMKFDNITLFTRVISDDELPRNFKEITKLVKEIVNADSLLSVMIGQKNSIIDKLVKENDFVILRLHSLISIKVADYVKKNKKTYMTEMMGDTWDGLWNHGILGKIIAPYAFLKTRRIVKKANYATYVTSEFLQKRYPCFNDSINASNVSINKIFTHKNYQNINKTDISLFTAAAVNVKYKGQQYVIRAIKELKDKGINVKYYLAGKGENDYLKNIAKKYGVSDNVFFLGPLRKEEVLEKMQNTDIYIQPSLQEGLPRSMIEAMSCGCVCLGARTAGIPELIDKEFVFKRKNVRGIVESIIKTLTLNLNEISEANIEKSKLYFENIINKRRFDYYDKILKEMEKENGNKKSITSC